MVLPRLEKVKKYPTIWLENVINPAIIWLEKVIATDNEVGGA
jgi:hypothetical protein